MILRRRSVGRAWLASLLVAGVVAVPAARAQDSGPAGGGADPNAPSGAAPDPNAPPPVTPVVQQASPAAAEKSALLMPFIGINSIQNDNSGTGIGFRVGAFGGARLNPLVSANFEVLFDLVNPSNLPSGVDATEFAVQAAVAPFVHLPLAPTVEVVVGPKAGGFYSHSSFSSNNPYLALNGTASSEGWLVGANLGAFVKASDALSVGGLFTFDYLRAAGCSVSVGTCMTSDDGTKMISFAGAVQF